MRCELPVPKRCCFCLPLRPGLLGWAYIKLILSGAFLLYILENIISVSLHYEEPTAIYIYLGCIAATLLVDMAFHILFVVGAHTKEYKKMRIFYRYSVVIFWLGVALVLLQIGICIYMSADSLFFLIIIWYMILVPLSLFIIGLVLQGYLIVLVRSEVLKLKDNTQFQFVNLAAEPQCTIQIDTIKEKTQIQDSSP